MPLYLGRAGNIQTLPAPARGVSVPPDYVAAAMGTLGGGRVVHRLGTGRRTWGMRWPAMSTANRTLVRALADGQLGRGPFVMYDPGQRNYLSPNQASGTDRLSTATGFTPFGASHGTVASSTAQKTQGERSLLWTLTGSPAVPSLVTLDWPHGTLGYPVVPNLSYAFSAQLSGSSASLSLRLSLSWRDAAGAELSVTDGAASAPNGSITVFAARTVIGVAPANAVYVRPRLAAPTTVNNATIAADQMQLELGAAVTTWEPGLGLPIVSFAECEPVYQWRAIHDMAATLVEVGRA